MKDTLDFVIDVDSLTSAAITEWQERKEQLIAARDAFAEKHRAHVQKMAKTEIVEALTADAERGRIRVHLTGKESKQDLVDKAVSAYTNASDAGTTLHELRNAAKADREMARVVNRMLENVGRFRARMMAPRANGTDETRAATDAEMAYNIEWGDSRKFMIAYYAARHAVTVSQGVAAGYDIRTVALATYRRDAMRDIMRDPGVPAREENLNAAAGAKEFVREVAWAYGRDDADDTKLTFGDLI